MNDWQMDPEYLRYKRKYPKFPGITELLKILELGNIQGSFLDYVLQDLIDNVKGNETKLLYHFDYTGSERVKYLILAALTNSEEPTLIEFYKKCSVNEEHLYLIKEGLEKIGTREARTALWEIKCNHS